jgi:hypothetical protein
MANVRYVGIWIVENKKNDSILHIIADTKFTKCCIRFHIQ